MNENGKNAEIQQPLFRNQKNLEEKYSFNKLPSENPIKGAVNYGVKYYKPNRNCLVDYFFKRIPFLKWIFKYNLKQNIIKDIIAGLTIGIYLYVEIHLMLIVQIFYYIARYSSHSSR